MGISRLLYRLYGRKLTSELTTEKVPHHVGVIMDGNRRWARELGEPTAEGHRRGARKILEFLSWCDEAGVNMVTLWMLSTDNLGRSPQELAALTEIISDVVRKIGDTGTCRVNLVGAVDVLPAALAQVLHEVADDTCEVEGLVVNVAVGYGGRREIADAVRSLVDAEITRGTPVEHLTEAITVDAISEHLYTKGQPDPDLVIRTSGEQRLSGFLLWQSAHSEFYFCDAYWPGFRRVDFLRALRDYAARERRFGG